MSILNLIIFLRDNPTAFNLSPAEFTVYIIIASHVLETENGWVIRQEVMAEECRISKAQLKRIIKSLSGKNLIEVSRVPTKKGRSNLYKMDPKKLLTSRAHLGDQERALPGDYSSSMSPSTPPLELIHDTYMSSPMSPSTPPLNSTQPVDNYQEIFKKSSRKENFKEKTKERKGLSAPPSSFFSYEPDQKHEAEAHKLGIDLNVELAKFKTYYIGKNKPMKDLHNLFSSWLVRAAGYVTSAPVPAKPLAASESANRVYTEQDQAQALRTQGFATVHSEWCCCVECFAKQAA